MLGDRSLGDRLPADLQARAREIGLFADAREVHVARAPGRLDVMGGIADYSGSLVLQLPLSLQAIAAAARRRDDVLRVVSLAHGETPTRAVVLPRADFCAAAARGYGDVRDMLAAMDQRWAAYVAGILAVLGRERGVWPQTGLDLLVASDVPEGKGVSSSAAIEVAAATAIVAALGFAPDWIGRRELALLCQIAENCVAGAACGVMDQMASACGRQGALLRLLCQPAEIEGHVAVPAGFTFMGVDSGVRHAVSGSDYTSVRTGAFMGFRILADLARVPVEIADGRARFTHPRWGRYLANVSPSEWSTLADRVPESMAGADFLARYGGISDTVTRVDPSRVYAVRQPTAHPILEHDRVRRFAALLPRAHERGVPELLGDLMYQSHASYSACGLGHPATDAIVAEVRTRGPAAGMFGAKITGGGSGGTVAVLVSDTDTGSLFRGRDVVTE